MTDLEFRSLAESLGISTKDLLTFKKLKKSFAVVRKNYAKGIHEIDENIDEEFKEALEYINQEIRKIPEFFHDLLFKGIVDITPVEDDDPPILTPRLIISGRIPIRLADTNRAINNCIAYYHASSFDVIAYFMELGELIKSKPEYFTKQSFEKAKEFLKEDSSKFHD